MRFLVVFLLFAAPLWADVSFPSYTQLDSKLGKVVVAQLDEYTQQVFVNGQAIQGLEDKTIALHGIYNHVGDGAQTVLMTTDHGGNGCFNRWIALRIIGNRIQPSARFGGCGSTAMGLRVDEQGLELDIGSTDLTHAYITYRFGSAGFTSTARLRNDTTIAPAAAGAVVTRWVGSHPTDIFEDTAERQRFRTVMGDDFLNDLKTSVMVANRVVQDNGYVYGKGCWPHRCNATAGVWAIRISDGAVFAVIWNRDSPAKIAGSSLAALPYRLQNFALSGNF